MRTRYVYRDGEWIDAALARPLHQSRSAPMIRPDGMEPIRSMATGKIHDSKSAYYGELKARGYEIVGDDKGPFDKTHTYESRGLGNDIEQSISDSIDQLRAGR